MYLLGPLKRPNLRSAVDVSHGLWQSPSLTASDSQSVSLHRPSRRLNLQPRPRLPAAGRQAPQRHRCSFDYCGHCPVIVAPGACAGTGRGLQAIHHTLRGVT
jgi:hypothetical protein